MKLLNKDPTDPEVTARVIERIKQMTPEDLVALLACKHGYPDADLEAFSMPVLSAIDNLDRRN